MLGIEMCILLLVMILFSFGLQSGNMYSGFGFGNLGEAAQIFICLFSSGAFALLVLVN